MDKEQKNKSVTVSEVLYNYLDTLDDCIISGWELYHIIYDITGINTYPSTLLTFCRRYANRKGCIFECLDRNNSKYHFQRAVIK